MSDFHKLVHRMRTAQRRYFNSRDIGLLEQCKELERLVDAEIEREMRGPTLFETQETPSSDEGR